MSFLKRALSCCFSAPAEETEPRRGQANSVTQQATRARSDSYGSSFYKPENIIGHTGDITSNPTVYYQDGDRFGGITTAHDESNNVGKSVIREASDYSIKNKGGTAMEHYGGMDQHPSRNKFHPASTSEVQSQLSTATRNTRGVRQRHADRVPSTAKIHK